MPEETARKILEAIKEYTSGARLTPNRRGVTFKIKDAQLEHIFTKARQIATDRGHSCLHSEDKTTGEHMLRVQSGKATRKREGRTS